MQNLGNGLPANARSLILTFLTIGLLCLYGWATVAMIHAALRCEAQAVDCAINQRLSALSATLQSLVSAVVITVLAISPSKGPLNLQLFGVQVSENNQSPFATTLALLYVVGWFLVGAAALGVSTVMLSDATAQKFSDLVNIGQSWLGLAIGAVYAYFGVQRTT